MHFQNPFDDTSSLTGYKILDAGIILVCFASGWVLDGIQGITLVAGIILWFFKIFSLGCGGIAALCSTFPNVKDWVLRFLR